MTSSPKWSSPDNSAIDLVYTHPVYGDIPFTARIDDVEQLGRDLFAAAVAGDFGPIADYSAPAEASPTLAPALWAAAYGVSIVDGEIVGLGGSARIAGAVYLDAGSYMVFLDGSLTSSQYFPKVWDDLARMRVTEKGDDYFVISSIDQSNNPVDPDGFNIEIIRIA